MYRVNYDFLVKYKAYVQIDDYDMGKIHHYQNISYGKNISF